MDARILVNDRNSNTESATLIEDVAGVLSPELLDARTFDVSPSENYNANIHYSFVPNRSSNLSADLSFGTFSSTKNTKQPNDYYEVGVPDPLRSVESEYDALTDINLLSAMLDYEKSINIFSHVCTRL